MSYAAWEFWIGIAQLLGTAGIGVYLWVVGRTRYNAQKLREHEEAVDTRLDSIEKEVGRLAEEVRHIPGSRAQSESLSRVHGRIDTLSERVAEMSGVVSGVTSALGRVNEYLLNQPK